MYLTNHLYERKEVLIALMESLLQNDKNRSMFWAYELYYSGYDEVVFDHLMRIYEKYYEKSCPKFRSFFLEKYRQWKSTNEYMTQIEKDRLLALILLNLLYRNNEPDTNKYVFVHIQTHVYYYPFYNNKQSKAYRVLIECCRYGVNDNGWLNKYEDKLSKREPTDLFDHWEYYMYCNNPIWKKRIQEKKGYLNEEKKTIEFMNTMYEEEFYTKYGYEPDEQPLELQKKIFPFLSEQSVIVDSNQKNQKN